MKSVVGFFCAVALVGGGMVLPLQAQSGTGQTSAAGQNEEELFRIAEEYFFNRKFEVAGEYLRKVLEKKPDHARAASLLGDVYLFRGEYEAALRMHRRAAELSPRPGIEYYRMGQDALSLERAEEAKDYFSRAHVMEPTLHYCLFQLGYIALVFDRDKDRTIFFWRRFLVADPQDSQADRIEEVLALLEDPDFELPAKDSPVSLEEALKLGGKIFEARELKPRDESADHLKEKSLDDGKELPDDDGL